MRAGAAVDRSVAAAASGLRGSRAKTQDSPRIGAACLSVLPMCCCPTVCRMEQAVSLSSAGVGGRVRRRRFVASYLDTFLSVPVVLALLARVGRSILFRRLKLDSGAGESRVDHTHRRGWQEHGQSYIFPPSKPRREE